MRGPRQAAAAAKPSAAANAEMRRPRKAAAAAKPSSAVNKGKAAAEPSSAAKRCRNCRNGRAPCLSPGIAKLCCNCLCTDQWRDCVNRCIPSDMSDIESSYESPRLLPDPRLHELQIEQLNERNEALDRRIDLLQEKQDAMSKEIEDLKKLVTAKIKKR